MANYNDVFGNFTVPPAEATYSRLTLNGSGTLAWPANFSGEVADQYLATNILEISAASAGLQLLFPPANEASVGQDIMVRNVGSESVGLFDADGGPLTILAAGEAKYIYTTNNSTSAGEWSVFTYGTGTSGADATLLAGEGLRHQNNKLQVSADHRGLDSDYQITLADRGILLNGTVGSLTLTTPDATATPMGFYCFIKNSSLGMMSLEGFAAQTVDGISAKSLSPGDSVILLKADEDWVTVGFGQSVNFTFSELVINAAAGDATLSSTDVSGRMIRVTGTATADIVVTLPSVDNIYFVTVEGGMGAYVATFKTAGLGGGVVALNANEKTALYSDGLNVTIAVTTTVTSTLSLTDGAAVAPSLFFSLDPDTGLFRKANNVLAVATGGTERAAFTSTGLELQSPLAVAQGGTGAVTAVGALTNLGATTNTRTISAGDGLTGGGDLTANRTVSMGTPSTISTATPNAAAGTTHTHALTLPVASDALQGIVELATDAETQAGADATRAVTPAGLNSRAATETRTGLIEIATAAEVQNGSDNERAVTPFGLASRTATETRTGVVELATVAESTTGVDTLRAVTPAGLKAALLTAFPVGSIYITAGNTNPGTFLGGTWVAMAGGRVMMNAGSNGTTNYTAGQFGGVESVALDINQMPSHNHFGATGTASSDHVHYGTTSVAGNHAHGLSIPLNSGGTQPSLESGGPSTTTYTTTSNGDHSHSFATGGMSANHTHAISFQGGGAAHENRMPYFVVHFWQRTA